MTDRRQFKKGGAGALAFRVKMVLPLFFALPALAAVEPPLMMMRLRAPHTADDAQWGKTFKVLHENRGACDEVWFSTGIGFPKMAWHEAHVKRLMRYAEQLRSVGIVPSLQFQATLGHDDSINPKGTLPYNAANEKNPAPDMG